MSRSLERQRRFYAARLRNERLRHKSVFNSKFGLETGDYCWVEPDINLDFFEPNLYDCARPRPLPLGQRESTYRDWTSLLGLIKCIWDENIPLNLLMGSMHGVGAIRMDPQCVLPRFRRLLCADAEIVIVATPDWTSWASFDVQSLEEADFRVETLLRGDWASLL